MKIRDTTEVDAAAICALHEAAFGPQAGPVVAALAVALLHDATAWPLVSLLAIDGQNVVGHILFTHVRIAGVKDSPCAHILAPLAVRPDRQRQGIGGNLVKEGLSYLKESGCTLVFVLGHPEYYPRFGFQPAGRLGFEAPYPIPRKNVDAWMVRELKQETIGNVRGMIRCAESLEKPEHWLE